MSAFKNSAITVCSVAFFTKANSVRCFGGDGTHKVPGSSPRDLADEYEAIIKKERVCELIRMLRSFPKLQTSRDTQDEKEKARGASRAHRLPALRIGDSRGFDGGGR